ncbi:MAG: hypothetical protein P8101_07335 [Candidatus Thiodiazotropha sp.]
MNTRKFIARIVLTVSLSTFSTFINCAPNGGQLPMPTFAIEGLDRMLVESTQGMVPHSASEDSGKAFAREISTITQEDLVKAAGNVSTSATELSNAFPEQNRANMAKIFNIALYIQQRIEKAAGVPNGDLATAVASFLYGAWSAYNGGAEIPDEKIPVLHSQIRQVFANNSTMNTILNNGTQEQRQKLYEYLAMTGNWMGMFADTLKQTQDQNTINTIREIAKQLYYSSFKLDIEKLHIAQDGSLTLS